MGRGFETTSQLLIDNHYKNISIEKLFLIQSDTEPIVQFWGYYFEFKHNEELGNSEKATEIQSKLLQYRNIVPKNIWNSLSINKVT